MVSKKRYLLSVIIPVFNEQKTILSILKKVQAARLPGIRKKIIIVNDGSSDKTMELLKKVKSRNLRVLHHEKNRGKGAAIRTAFPFADGDFVVIQDADLEYDPMDYPKLLEPLLNGTADVVYGSRFSGSRPAFTFWNYLANKCLTHCLNLLYNSILTDMETGYKVFRGLVFRDLNLRSNRFDFDPEITAKILKQGLKPFEVPISYRSRSFKDGKKITWWDGCSALFCLIRYRLMD
jgi:glycosyltransferase involved in cell wall biosynthesis